MSLFSDDDKKNMVMELINEKQLNSNDIIDVIAEQVYNAKQSDNNTVVETAKKLEKRFGSKYQQENITLNYNKKADDFGGYFMHILLKVISLEGREGIASCLLALEYAFDLKHKQEKNEMTSNEN